MIQRIASTMFLYLTGFLKLYPKIKFLKLRRLLHRASGETMKNSATMLTDLISSINLSS